MFSPNGTPYVVSKDNPFDGDASNAEDGTILLTINVPQNTSDADIDYDPVILGVSEAYWVSRKVSISQLRAGYGINLINNTESRIARASTTDNLWQNRIQNLGRSAVRRPIRNIHR